MITKVSISFIYIKDKKFLNIDETGAKYSLIDYTFLNIKNLNDPDSGNICLFIK